MVFPINPILDTFIRTNEGPPPSSKWTTIAGTGHKIVNNECVSDVTTNTQISFWNTIFGSSAECFFTINTVTTTDTALVAARVRCGHPDGADGYEVGAVVVSAGNDLIRFVRRFRSVNTTLTPDIDIGRNFISGDIIGIRVTKNKIVGFFNNAEVAYRIDNQVTGFSQIGIRHFGVTGNTFGIINFGGGPVPLGFSRTYRPSPYRPGIAR